MGLISGILGLPLAPLRDPGRIRAQLEEVARQRASGELSEEEADAWEEELVGRLMVGRTRPREG